MEKQTKTWNREMALGLFAHLVWICHYSPDLAGVLVWPYTSVIMVAFGLKQDAIKDLMAKGGKK